MILLVDADGIAFRNFYAHQERRGSGGEPCGVVFGVAQTLKRIVNELVPANITFCWGDRRANLWRRQILDSYKAHRAATAPEFSPQCAVLMEVIDAMGLPQVKCPAYEADDIIAALAKVAAMAGQNVGIWTSDHDMHQLVRDKKPYCKVYSPGRRSKDPYVVYDEAAVKDKWGVSPTQLPYLLAIRGEKGDGVPGIPGIGKVRAKEFILGSASASVKAKLEENKELVKRNLKLVDLSFIDFEDLGDSVLPTDSHPMNKIQVMAALKKVGLVDRASTLNTLSEFASTYEGIRGHGAMSLDELKEEVFGG